MTPLLVVMDRMYAEGRGGTERQVLRMLPALPAAGVQPHVLFLHHYDWHARAGFDFPWRELGLQRMFPDGVLRAAHAIRSEASQLGAGVVMSFFADAMLACAWARRSDPRLRFIATQRNLGTERSALKHWTAGLALRRADQMVVNSAPVRDEVLRRYRLEAPRVHVIDNLPATAVAGNPVPASVRSAVDELRARQLAVAVIVANLRPVKGVQDALQALSLPAARDLPLGVVVCGDGPSRAALESQARELALTDRVRFVGNVEGISACLPLFDFAILPSHAEGSANAGCEYAAAGLPFVATRVGGNAALLDESGAGLGVPAQDPGSLAQAIATLVGDAPLRQQLSVRGKSFSSVRPGESAVLGQYVQLIRQLAGEAGRP